MDFRTDSKTPKQRNLFIIMFWVFVPKNTHILNFQGTLDLDSLPQDLNVYLNL